ncbi:sensor histidine kinase [Lutispora saccharofermentans]|uniref:histidine kinase n=1 Tax=Lutispora saccharofermentans TaxID=3024236 RepID=A0ABT1NI97_9FIRM|nr:HAMP domain-containing sensor histidine kinase [Lutispora saccharofermentans]MCQ1531015.1 HAMP domain-containing histidine kinase [Lutispora saccharofermentans]
MKHNSIMIKLWSGIIITILCILFMSMFFQTRFLYSFYFNEKVKEVEKIGQDIARALGRNEYNFNIPYVDAIKNVNDMIIVTDISGRITYITGSVDYKQGWVFGLKYLDDILDGEKIQDGNKMLKGLDSLIIGVPIKRSQEPLWDVKQKQLYENEIESRALQEIIGAVYIVTPLEPLETTIQAIKIQFLYIFIGAIIISSLIALLLSHSFSDPLIKINDAAKEIARGNYNTKIHLKSSREIITLGETINNLARQLSRVEQIRREFIANVSHELRTPLSYLKGYTEILIDGLAETDSDREKYLNIILEESERLRKMVDEILHLSQIEAGSIQLKLSSFSIDALIKRTIDKILPLAVKRDISIKYNKVDDDLLLCLADENRIKQVLINLLTNATKHSYDHSNILISSYRLNDRIYICVRDFGEGISEEDLPFIWDRFYTAGKSKDKSIEGIGLGLSIIKSIINAHGCDITVNSVKEEGTEFCFWLPSYAEN